MIDRWDTGRQVAYYLLVLLRCGRPPLTSPQPAPPARLGKAEILGFAVVAVGIALAIRYSLKPFVSLDYTYFLKKWWDFIEAHGGFAALKHDFANYNMPYLYIITALTYLPIYPLTALKAVSVVFDGVIAFYAYRILALHWRNRLVPALGATAVMLLPTVFVNSSMWAQCDSIFTGFAIAGVYYLLRDRPWVATILFGLSFAFKLQAVFLFPLLLVLVLRRRLRWWTLLAIPAAYLLLDVPAWLAGRPWSSLLAIYVRQTDDKHLNWNAPNIFQFVPDRNIGIRPAAILFAFAVTLLLVFLVALSQRAFTVSNMINLATAIAILVPFFLPSMHERYFYLADVLSLLAACLRPRRLWYLPVLVQFGSLTAYVPFLFRSTVIDLRWSALAMAAALIVILLEIGRDFDFRSLTLNRFAPAEEVPQTASANQL